MMGAMKYFALLALVMFAVPGAAQVTWYVDDVSPGPGSGTIADPYTSIQYAINQASTLVGDTLVVRAGTYFENIDYMGKDIAIRSQNGVDVTTIDGGQNGSVVTFQSGESAAAVLEGFTITNGSGTILSGLGGSGPVGGGIVCVAASPTVIDCNIYDNYDNSTCDAVVTGGGSFLASSDATFADCVFSYNVAYSNGSGTALLESSPTFTRCTWLGNGWGNFCNGWPGGNGRGGGLYSENSDPHLQDCDFIGNFSGSGGGGMHGPGSVDRSVFRDNWGFDGGGAFGATLVDCSLTENLSWEYSGGPSAGGGAANCSLLRCVVTGNRGGIGGGLTDCVAVDTVIQSNEARGDDELVCGAGACGSDLLRCIVLDNVATSLVEMDAHGGGVAFGSASETLIAGNSADMGGGAFGTDLDRCTIVANISTLGLGGGARESTLNSCILRGNVPDQLASGAEADFSNIEGGWPGMSNIDVLPSFIDANNGNYHLAPGSPCIDTGDPALSMDLDGTRADMGAYQFVDCNGNGILDANDIASGISLDLNVNGFPDECECLVYNYCEASPHSTGSGATMGVAGTTSVSQNDFVLIANGCPPNKNGIFFYGTAQHQNPFGDGFRCVFGQVHRLTIVNSGPQGIAAYPMNYNTPPQPSGQITAGSRWNFQFWFRDPMGPGGSGFNLSDGLEVVFCE